MRARVFQVVPQAAAVVLAVIAASALLRAVGASPVEAAREMYLGSLSSWKNASYVLRSAMPLLLATAGVLVTFAAGLWNIGVEGQIMMGAVAATGALRILQDGGAPPAPAVALAVLAGVAGGAVWALLAGGLKTHGGVHEIFGGLGLNFVATAVVLWLIFGPWKRPGVGSMSGTEPFAAAYRMPELAGGRVSAWSLGLAAAGIALAALLLGATYFGLRLRAVGRNPRSAFRLGIPAPRCVLLAFALCGALAGAAGALQVTAVYHRLIPAISSGYGFLALLVALLAGFRASWAIPVALFFAAVNVGGIQLPIAMRLDSSFSGVLQGVLVLTVLLAQGVKARWLKTVSTTNGHE